MIAALDVHYSASSACAAAILFDDWGAEVPKERHSVTVPGCADYQPGQFYLRELSPLLDVIINISNRVDTYVIDGYCHLSSDCAPGLGTILHQELKQEAIIIGVAKNRDRQSNHAVEICRGNSTRPLFVTSIGIEYNLAGEYINSMAGNFRIPTLLKTVDRLARDGLTAE